MNYRKMLDLWPLMAAFGLCVSIWYAPASADELSGGRHPFSGHCSVPAHHPDFAEEQRYYPLSKYAAFPEKVRCLMQYADIESDICKGTYHGALTERACRRSDQMMERIERAGWCWDSYTATSADDHWMKCGDSPGYAYQHGLTPKRGYDDPNVPAPHEK